jgi:hypothetical protein
MFNDSLIRERRPVVLLKRASLVLLSAYVVILLIAGYRAYYQVRKLELGSVDSVLRSGSTIKTAVVSYARTPIEMRLELIQGAHSETLAVQHVPDNEWALFDLRNRSASQTVVLTAEVLKKFKHGQALVRATAVGRPQWMRLPPPVVRELDVDISN